MDRFADRESADAAWQPLYRIGGIAAVITALLIPAQVVAFVVWPPPLEGAAADWFALFRESKLLGLVGLDLVLVVDYVLLIPIVLALSVALRPAGEAWIAIGAALFFVAVATYFPSNPAFEMLFLSDRYAAATSDAERAALLAAGEAMRAGYTGTAFQVSYLLGSVAGIVISAVMLRGTVFGRAAAYAGVLGNVVGLGLYVPTIGIVLSVVSGLVLWIWYILVARGLFRLSRAAPPVAGAPPPLP